MGGRHVISVAGAATALLVFAISCSRAEPSAFVAPPRTIADLAAILEQEKPDPKVLAEFNAKANVQPPAEADRKTLAKFYFDRASARVQLGRVREAIGDGEMAVRVAHEANVSGLPLLRYKQLLGLIYTWSGDLKRSNEALSSAVAQAPPGEIPPVLVVMSRLISTNLVQLGDLDQAELAMTRANDYLAEASKRPGWNANPGRLNAEAQIIFGQAMLLAARGQFHEAAGAYGDAETSFRAALDAFTQSPNPPPRENLEEVAAFMPARAGLALAREGRLADAEIDARRALIGWLKIAGKYNLNTARILAAFSTILVEEGRYAEAEAFKRDVLDIYQTLGTERDSQVYAFCLSELADLLSLQNNWTGAREIYAALDETIAGWDQARKEQILFGISRIFTSYNVGRLDEGIAAATRLVELKTKAFGPRHGESALAQGALAVGLFRAGRHDEALGLFRTAAPVLLNRGSQADDDDAAGNVARDARVQMIIESYVTLLMHRGPAEAAEAFRLVEAIRARSVQKALGESSVRAVAADPALAELARTEQDLQKQLGAQLGVLNNLLAAPPAQRDAAAVSALQGHIVRMRTAHEKAREALAQRFPEYDSLIDPKPPTVEDVRRLLQPGEAHAVVLFRPRREFCLGGAKNGPIALRRSTTTSGRDCEPRCASCARRSNRRLR